MTPRPKRADENVQEPETIEPEPAQADEPAPPLAQVGPVCEGTPTTIEEVLAESLRRAAAQGAWSTVERLASELEARRLERGRASAEVMLAEVAKTPADVRQWIDRRDNQLGKRRHISAVRRRIAEHDPEARIVGRRHLLTAAAREAESELIGAQNVKRTEVREEQSNSVGEELGLRLVGGKR